MPDRLPIPDKQALPSEKQGLFAWAMFFARPHCYILGMTLLYRAVRHMLLGLLVYFFSRLIDSLQSGYAFEHPEVIWRNAIILAAVYFVAIGSWMVQIYESYAADKMSRGLRIFSMKHLLSLSLDWHEKQASGAKLQRVIQAAENVQNLYYMIARQVMPFIGELIGMMITVISLDVPIIFLFLYAAYATTYLTITWFTQKPITQSWRKNDIWKEELASRIYDFISLIRMTKAFSLDRYITRKSSEKEIEGHIIMRRLRFLAVRKWTFSNLSVWFWAGLIIFYGLHEVLEKDITIGAFSALIFMAQRLWVFLENMANVQMDYLQYKVGFLRIRETLCAPIQDYDVAPVVPTPAIWDKIECRNLAFSYQPGQPVLQDINLTIPQGKHIALIGHSGAGKSTMVKLLMKQIVPTGGDIFIGDVNLKNIESDNWLSHLALVPQDVELINASMRENILLDQDDIDENFYRECLCKSYLEDFVASLPEGDETQIGERGVKLSGGQKQRLGIARALARNADIIILDEATSSLDSESEAFIQRAMETAFVDKTVIVIAHRLSTIKHADMIYVFDKGNIVEAGDFVALEKSKGIFSRLWAMQSNGFISN